MRALVKHLSRTATEHGADIIENTPDLVLSVNNDGSIHYANRSWKEKLGYGSSESERLTLWDVIHPRSRETCRAHVDRLVKESTPGPMEITVVAKSGNLLQVEGSLSRRFDETGKAIGTNFIFRDLTDRKIAEQSALEEDAFQQILLNLATGFINTPLEEFNAAINEMLSIIGRFTRLDRVYVFKHDRARRVTSNTHEWCAEGISPEKDNLQDIPFDSFSDMLAAWERGELVHIPCVADMPVDLAMRPILEQQGIKSLVLIPLLQEKINTGFVGFDAVRKRINFSEREITLLIILAEIIANALARQKAEASLQGSENRFRGFVENSHDIIYMLNDQGVFTYVSPSWEQLLGQNPSEVQGKHFTDFLFEEDIGACLEFQARVLREEHQEESLQYRVKHKDGSLRWHASNGSLLREGDHFVYIGVARDMTERKQAEDALRGNEEKFRLLAENMSDIVWVMDLNLQRTYVSPSVKTVLGFTPEESINQSLEQTVTAISIADVVKTFSEEQTRAAEGNYDFAGPVLIEAEYYHKNGSTVWLESSCKPMFDAEGKIVGIFGSSRDITKRREAEMALREEQAFQQVLLKLATGFINVPLEEFDSAINEMLSSIGAFAGVDRVYVFRHDHELRVTSNTHEWCAEGISSGMESSQDIPIDLYSEMLKVMEKGEVIHMPDAEEIPAGHPIRPLLEEQGIKSLVFIPLRHKQANLGFVGFDAVKETRHFTERETSLLLVLAEIISNALARQQAEKIMVAQKNHLARWNQVLEQTVRERTDSIRNLLDNAGQGFLTFGWNLVVDQDYSAECLKYFGRPIAGQKITELLIPGSEEERSTLEETIFLAGEEEEQCRREIYLSLLPEEIELNNRFLELRFKLIENRPNEATKTRLMLIITDITEKRALESDLEKERSHSEMVVRVVSNHLDFKATLRDYRLYCRQLADEPGEEQKPADIFTETYRCIHTFKGAFHQFGMLNAVERLHELEARLISSKKSFPDRLNLPALRKILAEENLENWIDPDLEMLRKTLGSSPFLQDNSLVVETESLRKLEKKILNTLPPAQAEALLHDVNKLSWQPFRELLKAYPEYVCRIAGEEGKLVEPLVIEGGEMRIDPEHYRGFAKTLGHVFRNAIDHGIEPPEERIAAGKNQHGSIRCRVFEENSMLTVEISDDGRGLSEPGPKKETAGFVPEEFFSTKKTASHLSGRGTGLSALRSAVQKLGGAVTVKTCPGQGTAFSFHLPPATETN